MPKQKSHLYAIPRFKRSILALGVAASIGTAPLTFAQNETSKVDESRIEEVIVTVNRREQSLQDVSQTVQVFSGEQLEKLGINSEFSNLQFSVPGLQIANQEGKIEVYLRGIGSSDSDFSSDPSVATHYNGIYLPRPRGIGPLFFDSERVEVNKGPQGTLRGRNATGGTINIISKKPVLGEFSGSFGGTIGSFNTREVSGVVNIPTSENSAIRLSAWSKAHDGLYTNAFDDGGVLRTPSSKDDTAYRLSYRWQPSEEFTLDVLYSDSDVESSGDPGAFTGRSLSAGFDIKDLDDPWNQYFRRGGLYEQEVETFLVKASYNFDSFGVEYAASSNDLLAYNKNASREWQLGQNFPGSAPEAAFIASGANFTNSLKVNDTFYQADRSQSQTHEIRFYSHESSALQWTAGFFKFDEDFDFLSFDVGNGFCGDSTDWLNSTVISGDTVSCFQNGLGGENRGDDSSVSSAAFYADGTLEVTDNLRLIAGIRYTDEEKIQNDYNAQYQFNFTQDYLFSLPGIDEPSDIIIGGPGFRLTDPGERTINNANLGSGAKELFLDGVAQFGLGDNWGQVLAGCEQGVTCDISVSSQFGEGGSLRANNKVESDYVDWRLGFELDTASGNLLYATVSTGTRSGGVNRPFILPGGTDAGGNPLPGPQVNEIWEPEELLAFELGSKNTLEIGDYTPYVNAALFYYDYTNYVAQLLVDVNNVAGLPGVNQQVFTDNIGDASVLGLEVEGNIDLDYGFNINATFLYLNSEFKEASVIDSRNNASPTINVEGNDLPNVSDITMNLRISQNIDSPFESIDSFDWTINASYRSDYFLTVYNNKGYELVNGETIEIPLQDLPAPNNNGNLANVGGNANSNFYSDEVPAFWLVNLNAGMNFGDGKYRVDAYVENATNVAASTKGFINSSVNIRYLNAPRLAGVRFRANF